MGVPVADQELIRRARDLTERHGIRQAAATLGVSRDALTRVVAGLNVRAGTLALLAMNLRRGRPSK